MLFDKKDSRPIDDFSKTFKDYDIKDGAYLTMNEPGKGGKVSRLKFEEEEEKV